MTDPFTRLGRAATAALCACLFEVACGGTDDRPPPPPTSAGLDLSDLVAYDASSADARDVYASGACSDGATRQCRVYLPQHNDVQPCFVGEQSCTAGAWGSCESGTLVDANAGDEELDPSELQ